MRLTLLILLTVLVSCQSNQPKVEPIHLSEKSSDTEDSVKSPSVTAPPSSFSKEAQSDGVVFQVEEYGIYLTNLPESFRIISRPKIVDLNNDYDSYEINIMANHGYVGKINLRPWSHVSGMHIDSSEQNIDGGRARRSEKDYGYEKRIQYAIEAETKAAPIGIILNADLNSKYEKWFRENLRFHAPENYVKMIVAKYNDILPVMYQDTSSVIAVEWKTRMSGANNLLTLQFTNKVGHRHTTVHLGYVQGKMEPFNKPLELDETNDLSCRFWFGGMGNIYRVKLEGDSLNIYKTHLEEVSPQTPLPEENPRLLLAIPIPQDQRVKFITYVPESGS